MIVQNTEAVETKLLFISISMPRAVLLFGTLLIGFALGVLTAGRIARKPKQPAQTTDCFLLLNGCVGIPGRFSVA